MESTTTSFLMFFRDVPAEVYQGLSQDHRDRLAAEWNAWYEGLAVQGKVQHGYPLLPQGKVISGTRGERVVDGPFAEAKETIGGYFLLTVADIDEATEIAQQCPSLSLGMTVELRPIAHACPTLGVKGRPQAKETAHA